MHMKIIGHVDRCDNQYIEGWLFCPEQPDAEFALQIFAGTDVIGEVRADIHRPDLEAAGYGNGRCAFSWVVPEFLPPNAIQNIRLRLIGSDVYMVPPATFAPAEQKDAFSSRFGGLWIDRANWIDTLAEKHRRGQIDDDMAGQLFRFVRDGFLVIPNAVPPRMIAALNDEIDRFWNRPPEGMLIETFEPDDVMKYIAPDMRMRDGRTKLLDIFAHSEVARRVTAAMAPMKFLSTLFDETPKVIQQLAFWKGTQQPKAKDSAYVKIDSNPLAMAVSWLALEDITPGTGEAEYFVGSHRAPDFLFGGVSKWAETFGEDHPRFLASIEEDAVKYGHRRASFLARAGDMLIFHADLAHGSARITRPNATRRSLVTHFTPNSEQPFYRRFSNHTELKMPTCVFVSQYGPVK